MVNFKSFLVAAVGAASLSVAVVAGAQTSDQAPTLVVRYSADSLGTDSGARHLYSRLESAAERVCAGPQFGRIPSSAELACRKQAVSQAVEHIHNTRLAEISLGRSKIA